MSLPVIAEPLPTSYTFGKVVGRVIHLIADTAEDTDDKPQARSAAGKVTFAPKEVLRKTTEADYPAIVLRASESANLSSSGRILDAEGRQGIWLAVGIYTVTFEITGAPRAIPSFDVEVTAEHTDVAPLDLATAVPYVAPSGTVVQTVVVPSGGTSGQVLVRTADGGLAWADQTGGGGSGGGAVNSVNGQTGIVVLDATDVGAQPAGNYATATELSDGLATKVNSSTYTTGLAGKVDTADARLTDARTPTDGSVTNAKVATGAAINADKLADGTNNKLLTSIERAKLNGVANGATANDTDANLRNRANHTGTQATSTITGLDTTLAGKQDKATLGADVAGDATVRAAFDAEVNDGDFTPTGTWDFTGATVTGIDASTSDYQVPAPTGDAATDTANIQTAIDSASTAGGGNVILSVGSYATDTTITVPHRVRLIGQGAGGTVIAYSGTGIAVQHAPATEAYDARAGIGDLSIGGTSAAGATGLEVSDTYGFGIFGSVVVLDFTGVGACGVRLHNKLRWTEATQADDLHIRNCTTSLAFKRTAASGGHESFGWTKMNVSINVPAGGVGVDVGEAGDDCLLYNSVMFTAVWLLDNATGYKVRAGSTVRDTFWRMLGEEDGARTGTVGIDNAGTVTAVGQWAEGLGDSNTFGYFKMLPNFKSSDWTQGADADGRTYHQVATITPGVNHDAAFGFFEGSNVSSPYAAMYDAFGNALRVMAVPFGGKVTDTGARQALEVTCDGDVRAARTLKSGAGPTADRPWAGWGAGSQWFDTTLNKPIFSDGTNWRDAAGTIV